MAKLLLVDDDKAIRSLVRSYFEDTHEIVDTGEPEEALALALEHKPDMILLDLRMPRYSGFELCQTFTSFSSTQMIPVIVISGEAGAKTKQYCKDLGAVGYFEKPIDFDALSVFLEKTLTNRRVERRAEVRVRLRIPVKLRGRDSSGESCEALTTTENVSRSGFLCACNLALEKGSVLEVALIGTSDELVGHAEVVRTEWGDTQYPRYGFRFFEKTGHWVID